MGIGRRRIGSVAARVVTPPHRAKPMHATRSAGKAEMRRAREAVRPEEAPAMAAAWAAHRVETQEVEDSGATHAHQAAVPTASADAICRATQLAQVDGTMPSHHRTGSADRAQAPRPDAVHPASEAAEAVAAVADVAAADDADMSRTHTTSISVGRHSLLVRSLVRIALTVITIASASGSHAVQPSGTASTAGAAGAPETFATPEQAATAMVDAAEKFDVDALLKIVGRDGEDLVMTGEFAQDRERSQEFAAQARKRMHVSVDPTTKTRAYLIVGEEDWPFALPIVKKGTRWSFDAAGGRKELLHRRIGSNELDAIEICHGYVEAQQDFAFQKRTGYAPAQYAQRIIATPGQQDGLAWKDADGQWDGPIGEKIARAIQQGYDLKGDPYHGYFFKVLKAQGPAAPLGAMDFVVNGAMIGGFALVAAPAEYGETGVKTFMVSHTGVVYEKDFGPGSLQAFQKMVRFDPDKSWTVVKE
jgi:hypothetical protein